jgi:hypothetical protein
MKPHSHCLFLLAAAAALFAIGCSSDPPAPLSSLHSPSRAIYAPSCVWVDRWWPVSACPDPAALTGRGYLLNGESSAMSFINISGRGASLIDVKASVPGVSGVPIGERPHQLAATTDGAFILTLNDLTQDMSLVEVDRSRELTRFPLSSIDASLTRAVDLITEPTSGQFWLARGDAQLQPLSLSFDCGAGPGVYTARDTGGVTTCALDPESVTLTAGPALALPGTPSSVIADPTRPLLYVAYADRLFLSIIGLETATEACLDPAQALPCEVARLPGGLACADGLDNDGDGLTDAQDPQCYDRLGAEDLLGPGVLQAAACYDGLDNDSDGLADLFDPDCASPNDDDEAIADLQPPTPSTCADGLDNDGDGLLDNRDPDCTSPDADEAGFLPFFGAEPAEGACDNGLDDDGDGLIDLDDPGCDSREDASETPTPTTCGNGLDDDGDGLTDADDTGCLGVWGATETDLARPGLGPLGIDPLGRWLYVIDRSEWSVLIIDLNARSLQTGGLQNPFGPGAGVRVNPLPMAVAGDIRSGTIYSDDAGVTLSRDDASFVVATSAGTLDFGLVEQTFTRRVPGQPDDVLTAAALIIQDSRSEAASVRSSRCLIGRCAAELLPEVTLRSRVFVDITDGVASTSSAEGLLTKPADELFRAEVWSAVYEGALPGSERSDALIDLDQPDKVDGRGANFCDMGVEPGDHFVLSGFPTDSVGNIDRASCGAFFDAEGAPALLEWRVAHVRRDALYLSVIDEPGYASVLPNRTCFNRGVDYSIRPPGAWVVSGEQTNILLSQSRRGEACEPPRIDSLGSGRALEGELYENAFFSFTIAPDTLPRTRDQGLQFELRSGYVPLRRPIGGFPSDLKVVNNGQRRFLMIPDADRNQVILYDADTLGLLDPL